MTHTDPTSAALLRAILLHPADDTARLVYADWLDEHGEHERAEFIRVQCELARKRDSEPPPAPTRELAEFVRDLMRLESRERELLTDARRGEWSGIPCPVCEGKGWIVGPPGGRACRLCGDKTTNNGTGFAPVEFRRGFPERVRCRMGDVLIRVCGRCKGTGNDPAEPMHPCLRCLGSRKPAGQYELAWTLTPWAADVLAAHPVTAWEIVDREPFLLHDLGDEQIWIWLSDDSERNRDHPTACIPKQVYDALPPLGEPTGYFGAYLHTELARTALAQAVGRVARRLAGLPEATP